jgi:hypothetical protein
MRFLIPNKRLFSLSTRFGPPKIPHMHALDGSEEDKHED